jgi:phosphoribosylamine--glycine ligase/phosphoribosylformylglycinamidine cyclo-ligase
MVAGIPCFGPTPEAAQLEGSKAFAKDFMARYNIPTARYANFTDYSSARAYIESIDYRVVLKASGLALGKGVLLPESKEEALAGLEEIMVTKAFGEAGAEVVIEEFLQGQELSVLAFCDGYTALCLPGAQDHKRALDGDKGANTGGMGTYAPAPVATPELQKRIVDEVLNPTLAGMRKDGTPFVGMLFTGFMISEDGKKLDVLEYNVRFGDPETQSLLALLDDECDFADIIMVGLAFCPVASSH